jgi:hypothetical protein
MGHAECKRAQMWDQGDQLGLEGCVVCRSATWLGLGLVCCLRSA